MSFWRSLAGQVKVTLTSADVSASLTNIQERIPLKNVVSIDDLTVSFEILRKDLKRVRSICARYGGSIKVTGKNGIYWSTKRLCGRPLLVAGLLFLAVVSSYLPSRVFFIQVEGNTTVPSNLILEKAADSGISFGTSRRAVRSEKVKNALLEAMPQLQWAGVNTKGCTAIITVKERPAAPVPPVHGEVSSIVASRDGIIQEFTAIRGTAVCREGQAVRAGQTLISGYTDSTLAIHATRAEGEIFALTERFLDIITPAQYHFRQAEGRQIRKYGLIIGKKRINFYKGSGISDTSCVKMYSVNYIKLPGGFVLPIAVVTEAWTQYDTVVSTADCPELGEFAERYLTGQMTAGRILSRTEDMTETDDTFHFKGHYRCLEMIGIRKNEEIVKPYE